ncbi:MAG: tetratricopeptide repeat protein [Myxococcales bacterium]|nr:tetratricopeptide repeat protein [Myxococcales bacterium]
MTRARAALLALLALLLTGAAPPRLAVLELTDRAGLRPAEADYLTDLVRAIAGRRPGLLVLTRENIVELLPPGADLAACEADCEVEIGRRLGADFVVSGEIVDFGGELRVLLRLHATRTGALLAGERAGALRLADLEAPLEAAAARLLDPTGAPDPRATPAPPAPPIAYARVVPHAGPRIPPALFLARDEALATEDHHAADAALRAQITTAAEPERSALALRRGLLAHQAAAAITLRAFFAEDTCLARADDAAARATCVAARAARDRDADAARRLAIDTLTPLVARPGQPRDDDALLALADAHRALGDRAAARRAIDALTTRHPRTPRRADARLLLALMFTDEGRDDFAEAALRDLLRAHPGAAVAPYARYLLAWTHLRRDKHRAAITALRRVLADTARARADHPADRAEALLRRDARADLVQAWADDPAARREQAFALFAEIDPEGALRLPEALAELYLAQGRRADARAVLDRLRAELDRRCHAQDPRACGERERLCASYGGAACPPE